jgi:hypothetical protein
MERGKNFERVRGREKIFFLSEEIEIIHPMHESAFEKQRPGRTHDDMYFMPKFHQLVGQIGQVNSLAAAIGISPITQ